MRVSEKKLLLEMARACMNPQDLARAAELPPQTVNGIIRGRNVRPAVLGRIAKALCVDPSVIIENEQEEAK